MKFPEKKIFQKNFSKNFFLFYKFLSFNFFQKFFLSISLSLIISVRKLSFSMDFSDPNAQLSNDEDDDEDKKSTS